VYRIFSRLIVGFFFISGWAGQFSSAQAAVPSARVAAAVQWPTVHLTLVASGLPGPVTITSAGDHSGRLFVVEQGGTIQILFNGVKRPAPFLDIHTKISCCGERGLLGLAFPVDYGSKGHFYVYYTNPAGNIVIARYTVSANPNLADPNSGVVVLTVDHPINANHNGGQLAFGPDGYLYAGTGDGGSGGDPPNNAQTMSVLLGKILRIDVEGADCVQNPPKAQNYCIPANNPFVSTSGARPEIWSLGVRNPWRFSFDRLTGDLYIGDVGQDVEEEIDFQPSASPGGQNYGWRILEGNLCYNPPAGCTPPAGYTAPVATYDHGTNDSNGCAVTGGYVYRGPNIYHNMQGIYFYADYCLGKIYGLKNDAGWQTQLLTTASFSISTFGQDDNGLIYVGDLSNGAVYLLEAEVDLSALTIHRYFPVIAR
jgi:glucose/arabinose dehydrogenase